MLHLHAAWAGTGPGGKNGFYGAKISCDRTEVMVIVKIKNNSYHLLLPCRENLGGLSQLALTTTLQGSFYYYLHFTPADIEAQRG